MITTDMRKPLPKTLDEAFEANYKVVIWADFFLWEGGTPSEYVLTTIEPSKR
jgi:hypothetical protein